MAEYAALVAQVDATSALAAKAALMEYAEAATSAETATQALQRLSGKAFQGGAYSAAARELEQYNTAQQRVSQTSRGLETALRSQRDQARLNVQAAVELARATRELEREEAKAARTAEAYVAKIDAIEKSLSPVGAVTITLAQRVKTLDAAFAAGAISEERYARVKQEVGAAAVAAQAQIAKYSAANDGAARSMRGANLAGLDLSRQFADIGVTAAAGMSPLLILGQQGPQIADRLIQMRLEGVTLSAALKSMGVSAAGMLLQFGPIVAVVGAVVGVFALLHQEGERVKAAMEAAGVALERLQAEAKELADMSTSLATATSNSADAADGAASAYERQANSAALLAGKLRELNALQLGKEIRESEKRLKDMAKVGNDSGFLGMFRTSPNEAYSKAREDLLKELGFGAMGDRTGQNRSPDALISQARRNPMAFSADVRKLLNRLNTAEVERTGFNAAYDAERQYLARLYAEANPATAQQPTLLDEIEISPARGRKKGASTTRFDQSEQMIEAATRAELQARMALTGNIQEVADLRRLEIASELEIQNQRALKAAHDKSITAGAAKAVLLLNKQAAEARLEAVERERLSALAQQELRLRSLVNGFLDRRAQVEAALAGTASEANRVALEALQRRQQIERDQLTEENRAAIQRKEINRWDALRLNLAQRSAQEAERVLAAEEARRRLVTEAANLQRSELELRGAALEAQGMLSRSDYSRAVIGRELLEIEQEIARLEAERAVELSVRGSKEEQIAKNRLQALLKIQEAERELADRETLLINAIDEASDAVSGFANAFGRGDWARALYELERTIELIKTSFEKNGALGGAMTLGSVAATAVGGKTGRAIGGGLGIAGLGLSAANSLGAWGAAATAKAALLGTSSALGGLATTVAGVLGPIGLAAGALYAAAKIFNVGGKPTNAGAGFDLRTGALSGNKRTEETESAARSAGEAIQGIQDALKAAGIGITDAVTGLVLGTRDQTQIYLQSGKTLRSAIGDSGAAVDTAMRALLESATYVSDAQKKLVESAIAAGKGFDAVQEILSKYEAAQGISKSLADEILQLTKPLEYELKVQADAIAAQRKTYAQLQADGYLTAEALATINGQLDELSGLQRKAIEDRYAESRAASHFVAQLEKAAEMVVVGQQIQRTVRSWELASDKAARAAERAAAADVDALAEQTEAARVAREGLLKLGDVAGLVATDLKGRSMDAGSRASAARLIAIELSDRALEVENVGAALGKAASEVMSQELLTGRIQANMGRLLGDSASTALRDALGPFAEGLARTSQGIDGSLSGPGLAGVIGARQRLEAVQANQDVEAYLRTISRLNGQFAAGRISADEHAQALARVNALAGDLVQLSGDAAAQAARVAQATELLGITGAASVSGYLDQIAKSVEALNAAAREAADPVAEVSASIGRLNSLATVLSEGVRAASDGGSLGRGLLSTGNAEVALTISNAAAIAAQALTTSEAKRIAADLAKQAAFDGASGEAIRQAAFLIEGIREFDPASFEAGFARLNDALIKGSVTQAQYDALFAEAMETFQGATADASNALRDLQKSAGSLADELLLGDMSTLSATQKLGEADRQYREIFGRALSGAADASELESGVRNLLEAQQAGGSEFGYRRDFARSISDLRDFENRPLINHQAQAVQELQGLRAQVARMAEELAGMRTEQKAIGEQQTLSVNKTANYTERAFIESRSPTDG